MKTLILSRETRGAFLIAIAAVLIIGTALPVNAQTKSEGTLSGTYGGFGTSESSAIGKERLLVVFDENGPHVAQTDLNIPGLGTGSLGMGTGQGVGAALSSIPAPVPSVAPATSDLGVIPSAFAASPPPAGLVCPRHIKWEWTYEVGTGLYNNITYLLDICVYANGTGEAVAAIAMRNNQACQTVSWDDWRGKVIFNGSNMTFPAGTFHMEDGCNPAKNNKYPIKGVTFQWHLTANNTILDIITPFDIGRWNKFELMKTHY